MWIEEAQSFAPKLALALADVHHFLKKDEIHLHRLLTHLPLAKQNDSPFSQRGEMSHGRRT
ncbi:MAG: hypothetical protein H6669_07555 [Ardenticatenaceae bacterium]|nr:hypothetical protein [Ardenticatenaceae bacterium]